jgi:LAO/AO transport system kinase
MDKNSIVNDLVNSNIRALSKAITLVESKKYEHQVLANDIISQIYNRTGNALRIGITGPPGVGKSTLIDKLGQLLLQKRRNLAILAIDPSSHVTQGSILGDKTRMEHLVGKSNVFIRPSPSSTSLGGVTYHTREAILLCEAAGFDTVIVETVGVGQSEINIANMVDIVILLQLPNAGDELQGIKKGIIEIADIIVINKSDKNNLDRANKSKHSLEAALSIIKPKYDAWKVPVILTSSHENTGFDELIKCIEQFYKFLLDTNLFLENRKKQNLLWLNDLIDLRLKMAFFNNVNKKEQYKKLSQLVLEGSISPSQAVEELFSNNTLKSEA